LNGFDLALLVPYFLVLTVLALFGLHRYSMLFRYYRYRNRRATVPAREFDVLPRVTVQLPIFNEQFVVERLVESICALEYPRELLDIQLLDDSTDETVGIARACVERMQAAGHPISYIHRTNRGGFKAGALQEGLATALGEFIAIFDADFVPPADFLLRVVHFFADDAIGMVQTRWGYLNRDYSLLTRIEGVLLDGHFVLEHGARFRTGLFFNFNGTAGMWRRSAIEDAGGWQHDTLTEDTDLSYRAQLRGWKFIYLPDIECPSELPVEMTQFKVQQARWAKGLIQTSKKILPRLTRDPAVGIHHKIEAWAHLTANISYPFMILLCVLLLPAMIVRFYQGWFQMLYLDLPLFIAATFSVSSFYLAAQRELFPRSWWKTLLIMPLVMAVGIGISLSNSVAVIEGLLGIKSPFQRTPKFRIESRNQKVFTHKYRRKIGIMPFLELAFGVVFAFVAVYAFQNENYFTVPFILLFVVGYWMTGTLSLFQGRFRRGLSPTSAPASSVAARA
jgi:cellulose synthase/poly-beta-1,6-N-acetylglucosamine synthase-like glycosyltransferase